MRVEFVQFLHCLDVSWERETSAATLPWCPEILWGMTCNWLYRSRTRYQCLCSGSWEYVYDDRQSDRKGAIDECGKECKRTFPITAGICCRCYEHEPKISVRNANISSSINQASKHPSICRKWSGRWDTDERSNAHVSECCSVAEWSTPSPVLIEHLHRLIWCVRSNAEMERRWPNIRNSLATSAIQHLRMQIVGETRMPTSYLIGLMQIEDPKKRCHTVTGFKKHSPNVLKACNWLTVLQVSIGSMPVQVFSCLRSEDHLKPPAQLTASFTRQDVRADVV